MSPITWQPVTDVDPRRAKPVILRNWRTGTQREMELADAVAQARADEEIAFYPGRPFMLDGKRRRPMKTASFDSRCADLALTFLDDDARFTTADGPTRDTMLRELARTIQRAVEDWLTGR